MNEKVYMEFNHPKEKSFAEPSKFQRMIENTIDKFLTTIIPNGNPEFHNLIQDVEFWKVEYDVTENEAWREIGFDKHGISIVAMPLRENYGFWTDNNLNLDDFKKFNPKNIDSKEFETDWTEFENKTKK
jgi:hypothetical protein